MDIKHVVNATAGKVYSFYMMRSLDIYFRFLNLLFSQ
jgi:hypothetical protein